MLNLLIGRSGSGKTAALLDRVCRGARQGRSAIFLVPEQFSHETERLLCEAGGNQVGLYAEVLSFTRLSNRVFAVAGGLAEQTLDNGGRLLLMHRARQSVEKRLRFYAVPSKKPSFLSGLLATVDELKSYAVTPEALWEAAEQAEGAQADRLRDLSLLYGAYNAMTARDLSDPRDRMTRLAEALARCDFARGTDIYVDGFTDFTPSERLVLEQLVDRAGQMTVALTCDSLERGEEDDVFAFARQTGYTLLRMAKERGIASRVESRPVDETLRRPALIHLEAQLFADVPVPFEGDCGSVSLYEASAPFSEVEYTAAQILRLVRETGCRFREIGVAVRGFEEYAALVETVFARYGVPVFLNRMTDILQKPVLSLVTAALDVLSGGFETDDVFRYIKTGLTGLTPEECDRLENYALLWSIRGAGWSGARDWDLHPRGYGQNMTPEDIARLAELNRLRRKALSPLLRLRGSGAGTAREQALALYDFLEELGLAGRLEQRSAALEALGERKTAEEYSQLWDILMTALEQCVEILGEAPMELTEFGELLALVLSQYDVGTIPVSLDRVAAGEAPRMAHKRVKYLFWLGAVDTAVPLVSDSPGLLAEEDRLLLEGMGLELAPGSAGRLAREMAAVYSVCAVPTEGFFLSWPRAGADGEEFRPSFLAGRVRRLFPGAAFGKEEEQGGRFRLTAPLPALDAAAVQFGRGEGEKLLNLLETAPEGRVPAARIRRAAAMRRGALSPEGVEALYGRQVKLSASRMDRFKSCHFAYFMQYGLKVKPRRPAGFDAPEMGSFVHYVLQKVLLAAAEQGGAANVDHVWLQAACKQSVEQYAAQELGGLENKTPRFRYLFRRLLDAVTLIVENVADELRSSDFQPISFELGFGGGGDLPPIELTVDGFTLSVSGFVDRVDGWEKDGKLYLRVVDYKTGRKKFDLTEIWNGMGMQMLLYLFALGREGKTLYGKEIVPSGVLYLPARQVILRGNRDMPPEERRRRADAELRRRGLLLSSPEVLAAMERWEENGVRFLPIKVSAGVIGGDALATPRQFELLSRHLDGLLVQIARELREGRVDADPWYRGPLKGACLWCDFAGACHFDEGCGDKKRYLPGLKDAEFWARVEHTPPETEDEP